MQYNNKENRKQESSKYNPYEGLISGYINNNYSVSRERYDSTSLEKLDPEKYRTLNLVFNELTKFLQWNKHDDFNWTKYGYMYPNAQKYLLSKGITISNKHRDIYPIYYDIAGQINKSKEIRSFQVESDSPRGRYGSSSGYDYEDEYTSESETEYEGNEYSTDSWGDYSVHMEYYRTMGIYVPDDWKIDGYITRNKWQTTKSWEWVKVVLEYAFPQRKYVPVPSFIEEAGTSIGTERRQWYILPHLAFANTLNRDLYNKLVKAFEKSDYSEENDFKVVTDGLGGDPRRQGSELSSPLNPWLKQTRRWIRRNWGW